MQTMSPSRRCRALATVEVSRPSAPPCHRRRRRAWLRRPRRPARADDSFLHAEPPVRPPSTIRPPSSRSPCWALPRWLRARSCRAPRRDRIPARRPRARHRHRLGGLSDDHRRALRRRLHRPPRHPRRPDLIGVGAATLWRSRKMERPPLGAMAAAAARRCGRRGDYFVPLPARLRYVVTHVSGRPSLRRRSERHTRTSSSRRATAWSEGLVHPSKNGAAVIAFPGRRGTQQEPRMLADHGYGVLLFDRRGEGRARATEPVRLAGRAGHPCRGRLPAGPSRRRSSGSAASASPSAAR